jgi:hypothetical protein
MRATLLLALLAGACALGPESPTPGDSDGANYSRSLGPAPDFTEPQARILVRTYLAYDHTALSGFFADGPQLSFHRAAETQGNCRVVRYSASTCEPRCEVEEACIDSACVPYPVRVDRGPLDWAWPDGSQTVHPDSLLQYSAQGGATRHGWTSIGVDGLELEAPTIEPPDPDVDWSLRIQERGAGEDVTLRWSNAVAGARVRLHMTDCIGSHGGLAPAELQCEGPDTGELTLPGAFIEVMEGGDWSHGECGSQLFERYHSATPKGDPSIRFETVGDGGFFWRPDW